jgi:hypothetical protein
MTRIGRTAAVLGAVAMALAVAPAAAATAAPATGTIRPVPCTADTLRLDTGFSSYCYDGVGSVAVNIPNVRALHSGTHAGRIATGDTVIFAFRPNANIIFADPLDVTRITLQS